MRKWKALCDCRTWKVLADMMRKNSLKHVLFKGDVLQSFLARCFLATTEG